MVLTRVVLVFSQNIPDEIIFILVLWGITLVMVVKGTIRKVAIYM
jgi:hypothetical protein